MINLHIFLNIICITVYNTIVSQKYTKGDSIEDCLYRVIKERGGTSAYSDFDDAFVLSLYTLFPDEFCKWVMFKAYDEQHSNIYEEKCIEVLGENRSFRNAEALKRVGQYFSKTAAKNMNRQQLVRTKEMLEMLGVRNIKLEQVQLIDEAQLEEVATSETAMEQLEGGFKEIKDAYKEIKKTDKDQFNQLV